MLKRAPGYLLTKLQSQYYLLPYGQRIADFYHGFSLNETGAEIWNLINDGNSEEDIINRFLMKEEIQEADKAEVTEDVRLFLHTFLEKGLLEEAAANKTVNNPRNAEAVSLDNISLPYLGTLKIADLSIRIECNEDLLSDDFSKFLIQEETARDKADQILSIHKLDVDEQLEIKNNDCVLIRDYLLNIIERKNCYELQYPSFRNIRYTRVLKNGSKAEMYYYPCDAEKLKYEVFHAERLVFLLLALRHNMIAIHSASILYQGKAWLFSAPSGTGKSTHTKFWHDLYQVPYLNGDLNLMGFENGEVIVYGMPWCGTSGIATTEKYPLGGIVLLQRDERNFVEELAPDQQQLGIFQRLISPTWLPEQVEKELDLCGKIIHQVPVMRLHCTNNPDAAEVMKDAIDHSLKKSL